MILTYWEYGTQAEERHLRIIENKKGNRDGRPLFEKYICKANKYTQQILEILKF